MRTLGISRVALSDFAIKTHVFDRFSHAILFYIDSLPCVQDERTVLSVKVLVALGW